MKKAAGKKRDEICELFGNTPEPIAKIHEEYTKYLDPTIKDSTVYCGKGYFIDHAVNHHPEVAILEYQKIPEILNFPDDVRLDTKKTARKSLVFIKKYDNNKIVIVSTYEDNDKKLVFHKSFFTSKKRPYKTLIPVGDELPLSGATSDISHTDESAPAGNRLSGRNGKKTTPNQDNLSDNQNYGWGDASLSFTSSEKSSDNAFRQFQVLRAVICVVCGFFFLSVGIPVFAHGQKDKPYIPAEVDPDSLPLAGIAPFTSYPPDQPMVQEDADAIRNMVFTTFQESGYFHVESNEQTESLLQWNGITTKTIFWEESIKKLQKTPLNYVVLGAVERVGNNYIVNLRLLTVDKMDYNLSIRGYVKMTGRETRRDVTKLTGRFIKMIDTAGVAVKHQGSLASRETFEYEVGDRGPGGGYIIYKKATAREGWRYLEAAPDNAEFFAPWGYFENGIYGPDGFSTELYVGAGRANTRSIIARMNSYGKSGSAAQAVSALTTGGKTDWFLPSKDEMTLIWDILGAKGIGNFTGEPYWTSSQSDPQYVWYFDFRNGKQYYNGRKPTVMRVRAIRAF
ncbi:MAG: DUF1566 domain-containing protein [Spirochaetaceae bacterium]|nr:DUF1566 domain-containing protein [Spirochaetaceae bacterium]